MGFFPSFFVKVWEKDFVVARCNNSTIVNMKNNSTICIMSWWCNLGNGDLENQTIQPLGVNMHAEKIKRERRNVEEEIKCTISLFFVSWSFLILLGPLPESWDWCRTVHVLWGGEGEREEKRVRERREEGERRGGMRDGGHSLSSLSTMTHPLLHPDLDERERGRLHSLLPTLPLLHPQNLQHIDEHSHTCCDQHDVSVHFKILMNDSKNCLVDKNTSQYPDYQHWHHSTNNLCKVYSHMTVTWQSHDGHMHCPYML